MLRIILDGTLLKITVRSQYFGGTYYLQILWKKMLNFPPKGSKYVQTYTKSHTASL
jgi:hypothetical protein